MSIENPAGKPQTRRFAACRPLSMILAVALCALAAGCRREDVREVTISVPGMNATNLTEIVAALGRFEGTDRESIQFDREGKKVSLRYDSMKVAQTNLRMAIEEQGIAVEFPEKTTGKAGYINSRK